MSVSWESILFDLRVTYLGNSNPQMPSLLGTKLIDLFTCLLPELCSVVLLFEHLFEVL